MDNRSIDVVSEGEGALRMALTLIWPKAAGGKATHYKIARYSEKAVHYGDPTTDYYIETVPDENGKQTLILLWHDEKGSTPLPYPLKLDDAVQFVSGWLKHADYGESFSHDGDNGCGFRAFTDHWGHVCGHDYGIVAIQPEWALYGK